MGKSTRIFAVTDTHLAHWPTVPDDIDLILFGGDFYDGPSISGLGDDPTDAASNALLFPGALRQAHVVFRPSSL